MGAEYRGIQGAALSVHIVGGGRIQGAALSVHIVGAEYRGQRYLYT